MHFADNLFLLIQDDPGKKVNKRKVLDNKSFYKEPKSSSSVLSKLNTSNNFIDINDNKSELITVYGSLEEFIITKHAYTSTGQKQ